MEYSRLCFMLLSLSGTGVSGYFVVVTPSPTAEVVSGQNLSITCQWSADYTGPNAAVYYRLNDGGGRIGTVYINFGTCIPSTTPPYTLTCNRDTRTLGIQIPANSYSHGDKWTCEGRNDNFDGTTPPQTNTTTVGVKDVTGLSVVVSPSPIVQVVSGQNLSITCQWSADYTGPNAAVNYRLNDGRSTIGGVLINFGTSCKDISNTTPYILTCNKGTRTLGIHIPATSYSHGDRWMCEGRNNSFDNTSPTQRDTTTVYVEVPVTSVTITPSTTVTVEEGTSTILTCTTQPHSRPTVSVTWYRVVSGQPQQITANISVSHDTQNSAQTTTSLLSYVPSKEDIGRTVYCVSDGGWTGSTDTTLESGRVSLNVRYRPAISIAPQDNPYVITEGQIGISLVCKVTSANPPATSIVWTREATEVSYTGVYNLTTITKGHSGEYSCSATNDVGTTSESITLVVISSPAEPDIVGITNVSSSSLTVKWSPNDESSEPSTFNVSHRCKRCEVPDTTSIVRIPNKGVYSTTFNNLLPETLYYVNITAINQVGSSNPLDLIVSTQPEETCFTSLKGSNSSSTALIVVGAILIFISFTVLGFSILLYRKSRLPSRPVDQQEETPKSVVFSSVLRSEKEYSTCSESDLMPAEETKSHYQELDPSDIQPPSAYECLSRDDDAAIMKYERDNYESLQGDSVKRDYEQLHVDDESKHYLNT